MRLARLQAFALALPHPTVVKQRGECLVHKVAGKMFLILVLDGGTVAGVVFKCTPAEFDDLTAIAGIIQAPYCAKRRWAKLEDLATLSEPALNAAIRRSYELVAAGLPQKTQVALGILPAQPARNHGTDAPGRPIGLPRCEVGLTDGMATKPWKRKPAKPAAGRKLTPENIAWARARAQAAGRRYPNLLDNMAASRRQAESSLRDGDSPSFLQRL